MRLRDLVIESARRAPAALAVRSSTGNASYRELDDLANQFAHAFASIGVKRGDRVGIWLEKSIFALAAMQGVLRLSAVYVPLDPQSPPARIGTIVRDCEMRLLVTTAERKASLVSRELSDLSYMIFNGEGADLRWPARGEYSSEPFESPPVGEDEMVYILYTSGSTGVPKGVCLSNRNALAFVRWAAEALNVNPRDRLANHAPFHFDISVFDIYAAFLRGAAVCLIPDGLSFVPAQLVRFVIEEQITVWYSVPSALILMMREGGFLDCARRTALRAVLFAGEPFPINDLRQLYRAYPRARFLNLYGPTETNVCTFYEVEQIDDRAIKPVPIGRACSGDRVWAVTDQGREALPGEEGELLVEGPTVMLGYWGRPALHQVPYPTGDIVRLLEDGNYLYVGRRDHMVKVHGYRIEIGEVEAILSRHPAILDAAVTVAGSGMEARLIAFLVCKDSIEPALLEIKRYCAERLPRYMIVDAIRCLSALPRTRNGKIDRLALTQSLQQV